VCIDRGTQLIIVCVDRQRDSVHSCVCVHSKGGGGTQLINVCVCVHRHRDSVHSCVCA